MSEENNPSQEKSPENLKTKQILSLEARAEEAHQKNNFGYSAEIYWTIYQKNREAFSEYLQKMLLSAIARKCMAKHPPIYSFQMILKNLGLYVKSLTLKPVGDKLPDFYEVLESIIKDEPDSGYALLKLSDVYIKEGLKKNACILLDSFTRTRKNRLDVLKKLGDLAIEIEDPETARDAFKKVLALKPFDRDADKKLKDVMALISIDENKLKKTGTFRDFVKDSEGTKIAQLQLKMNKTPEELSLLISLLEKEVEDTKSATKMYDLIKLYKEKGDQPRVVAVYEKLSSMSHGDLKVLLEKLDEELLLIKHEHPDLDEETLVSKVLTHEEAVLKDLVSKFGSSVDLKFKYAKCLYAKNQFEDALTLFQTTANSSEYEIESMHYMGNIMLSKDMTDLAIEEFQNAIEKVSDMNTTKKELIYSLGVAFDKVGKNKEALEEFKKIFKVDVAFKDVRQKIEASYKK